MFRPPIRSRNVWNQLYFEKIRLITVPKKCVNKYHIKFNTYNIQVWIDVLAWFGPSWIRNVLTRHRQKAYDNVRKVISRTIFMLKLYSKQRSNKTPCVNIILCWNRRKKCANQCKPALSFLVVWYVWLFLICVFYFFVFISLI